MLLTSIRTKRVTQVLRLCNIYSTPNKEKPDENFINNGFDDRIVVD
jgi:hypothetical protein